MKNIIFIAPPAAGKGTVSDILITKYGYIHISTGTLLREEINKKTELGEELDALMIAGKLVPDELITELLTTALKKINKPFILDGYPRNVEQAIVLDKLFSDLKIDDYVAIYLDIEKEEAIKRATGRLICLDCKISFHKYDNNQKPKIENICDRCGAELGVRSDDTIEAFNKRYETFLELTYPLVEYYKNKRKIKFVDINISSEIAIKAIEPIINEEA